MTTTKTTKEQKILAKLGDVSGLVLTFSTVSDRGALHSPTCSVVSGTQHLGRLRRSTLVVIRNDVQAEVEDLVERQFKVARCACCK
jgi:hypothetical protein